MTLRVKSACLVILMVTSLFGGLLETDNRELEEQSHELMAQEGNQDVDVGWTWDCLAYSTQEICDSSYLEGESHNSYLDILTDSSTNLKIRNLPDGANDEMVHMDAIVALLAARNS